MKTDQLRAHDPNCRGCARCKHFYRPFPHASFCQEVPCKCRATKRAEEFEKSMVDFLRTNESGTGTEPSIRAAVVDQAIQEDLTRHAMPIWCPWGTKKTCDGYRGADQPPCKRKHHED